jgi:hypothetical protein
MTMSGTFTRYMLRHRETGFLMLAALLGVGCTTAQFRYVGDAGKDGVVRDEPKDDVPRGEDAKVGTDVRDADSTRDSTRVCPAPTLTPCQASAEGSCDPVCQTDRGCNFCVQKCSYLSTNLAAGSQPECVYVGAKARAFESCEVTARGTPQETDGCGSGLVCMPPAAGEPNSYCFQLCRSTSECYGGTACGARTLEGGKDSVSVCDPPYDQCGIGGCCNPLAGSGAANGCPTGRTCLLVDPDPVTRSSRTVCEFTFGDGRNDAACTLPRDCQQRFTCVNNYCRQVCTSTMPCPAGSTCQWRGTEYGWCK